jgi:hypothetical protein
LPGGGGCRADAGGLSCTQAETANGYATGALSAPEPPLNLKDPMVGRGDLTTAQWERPRLSYGTCAGTWAIPELSPDRGDDGRPGGSVDHSALHRRNLCQSQGAVEVFREPSKSDQTVDFLSTARRNQAAKWFLQKAIRSYGIAEKHTIWGSNCHRRAAKIRGNQSHAHD